MEGTEPCVQRLFHGPCRETGMGPQGLKLAQGFVLPATSGHLLNNLVAMEEKSWFVKNESVAIWGVIIISIVILIILNISHPPSPEADAEAVEASTTQSSTAPVTSPTENADAPKLVRKTETGIVRTSVISFNQTMGINQQTIIFGGDEDAIEDGTGLLCVINGEKNFVNVVSGDTVTVTGEEVQSIPTLINCRIDSVQ